MTTASRSKQALTWLWLMLLPLSVPAQNPSSATQTIERYLSWRGGDAYAAVRAIEREGRIEVPGMSGTVRQLVDDQGRRRQDLDLGVIATASGNDLDAGWLRNQSGQVERMQPAQVEAARRGGRMDFASGVRGAGGTVSLLPPETLDGREWSVLRVAYGRGEHYDLLLDDDSGALHALRAVEDGRATLTRFEDWREVDGVRHAFAWHETAPTGDEARTRWDTIAVIGQIDPERLAAPDAVSKARFADAADSSGWIDFEFFREQRIFIPARVNGHDTVVLLDSGAESSVLDSAFAESIGLTGAGQVTALGTGGTQAASFLTGVDIELGNLRLEGITAVAIDFAQVSATLGHALPVVLGKEILNDTTVEIDFDRRRIAFHHPDRFRVPEGFREMSVVTGSSGIRLVDIGIEGGDPMPVDFDLGNGGPLLLYPSYWQREGWLAGRRVAGAYGGAVGGMREQQVTRVKRLSLAGFDFHDVPATLTPPGVSAVDSQRSFGNIGLPVFTRFHLIIDYPRDRLLLAPGSRLTEPFPRDRSGLVAIRDGDALKVVYVVPETAAARDGWQVGDEIVAIDGTAVAGMADPLTWRLGPAGTNVRLSMRDGTERNLERSDYF